MTGPAIRPTITQRVRIFLDDQGAPLVPWSDLDRTYGELYGLLNAKRDDATFWPALRELLGRVLDSAAGPPQNRGPRAEILSSWDVDELVRELRAALPGDRGETDAGVLQRFLAQLPAPVMAGFLLLGIATFGCDHVEGYTAPDDDDASGDTDSDSDGDSDADSDTDSDGDADSDTDADTDVDTETGWDSGTDPWDADCDLESSTVLWSAIDESELDDWIKKDLCLCFEGLNGSWDTGLTELFDTGSPEQIAAALEEMVECCTDDAIYDSYDSDTQQGLLEGWLCDGAIPVYKGVAFPRD